MLYYYHFKCILTLITLITLTLILNLALTFSLTLSRIVHSSFTSNTTLMPSVSIKDISGILDL